ncbi:hypothetical protein Mapa_004971 [Marchantia paleacea]|nr:hypothetical protein Mapa_004971 [Marchantia paleacea]
MRERRTFGGQFGSKVESESELCAYLGSKETKGGMSDVLSDGLTDPTQAGGDDWSKNDRSKNVPPVIDMGGLNGLDRERVNREIADACANWGFFQVINHGVDLSLMRKSKEVAMEFFQLPIEEKMKFTRDPRSNVYEGYHHPVLSGQVAPGMTQTLEYLLNVYEPNLQKHRDRVPTTPTAYGPTIAEYTTATRDLAERILHRMSNALGVDQDAMYLRLAAQNGSRSIFRLLYYEPKMATDNVALMPHTDPGALTLVLSDEVSGLQVKKGNQWLDIDPVPDAFIVNVGDMAEVLSNGRYRSAEHRGVYNKSKPRVSLIHFYSPDLDATLGPLEDIVDDTHPAVYKSFIYKDYHTVFVTMGLSGKSCIETFRIQE